MNLNSHKLSSAISSLVIGGFSLLATLQLRIDQKYSDFIVGNIAWSAGNKSQDLIALPVFIISFFLSFSVLSKISLHLQENHGDKISSNFNTQLILWSLPFYASAATMFLGGAIDHKTARLSLLGIIALGTIGLFKKKSLCESDPNFWSATLFAILLTSLIPVEIAVLLSKASISLNEEIKAKYLFKISNILIVLGFIFSIFAIEKFEKQIAKHASKLILAAQIFLPLFYLTLYPSKIIQPSGEISQYKTTIYLNIFLFALVSYGIYDVVKRFRSNFDGANWQKCFSPFALFALAIALKVGHTTPPHISPDDYHFGEYLIGWWSYLKGFVPYVDYVPSHGVLENDFGSILSYIFYDGTAASIGEARRLAFTLLGFFAFISIYLFTNSLAIAFSAVLLLGGRLFWLFFVPFICLWLTPNLRAQPGKWLSIWIFTAPIVILGVPPQGLLLVAAFGLLALKITWDQIRFGDKKSWQLLGLTSGLLLLTLVLTPMFSMLVGAIRYVIENGPINQIAYGIPWSGSWNTKNKPEIIFEVIKLKNEMALAAILNKSGFTFEFIRMSWVVIPLLCLYFIRNSWQDIKDSKSSFYTSLVFLFFSLSLIPYSMGRIDPYDLSRPGLVSNFIWAVVFPILLWKVPNTTNRVFIVLSTVFMSALPGLGLTFFSGISSIAEQKVLSLPLRDSAIAGLPNIGHAYIDESQWSRINKLNSILKMRLSENETYLDLTSRNAHYFYLNRLPATAITAPYNLASPAQQKRAVDKLTASPPKISLLQADNILHDGGGLALRNHYLYKFVINNYTPRVESGFIVGYLKSKIKEESKTEISVEVKNLTDENWLHGIGRREPAILLSDSVLVTMLKSGDKIRLANEDLRTIQKIQADESAIWLEGEPINLSNISSNNTIDVIVDSSVHQEYITSLFHRAFSISDFQKIPVSWGKSEKSLQNKMTVSASLNELFPDTFHLSSFNGSYIIEGKDPQLVFNIASLGITGHNSGLLKFDFKCIGKTSDPRIQVFWWGDNRDEPFDASSVRLTAENGTLIVPLDTSPWWTRLHKIKGIRFDLDNPSACQSIEIKNISLHQRK